MLPPFTRWFDHTYVTTSCGLSWGCHGRAMGGVEICRDVGDREMANCLAGSNGMAGIRYGRTGLCHQISNRILYSANQIKVVHARGYRATKGIFGSYGHPPWPELASCSLNPSVQPNIGSQAEIAGRTGFSKFTRSDAPNMALLEGSAMRDPQFDGRVADLAEMLRESGVQDPDVIFGVTRNHLSFWNFQEYIINASDNGTIGAEEYLKEFNNAVVLLYAQDKEIMGEEVFYRTFGEEADHASEMIDPKIFFDDEPEYKNYG